MKSVEVKQKFEERIRSLPDHNYEHYRWLGSAIKKGGYEMTRAAIENLLPKIFFKNYIEVGSGPGTWTKLFLEKEQRASFDLVDLSDEMVAIAKKNLGTGAAIRYINADFLAFIPDKKYDFFFSSRTIEYVENKNAFIEKVAKLLISGGAGLIITKTPKYRRQKLLGKSVPPLHRGQITPRALSLLLEKNGLIPHLLFPVTFSFPFFNAARFNRRLFTIFGKKRLNPLSAIFAESYCIFFKKP